MERKRMTNWWIHWEDLHWPNPDSMEFIKRKAAKYAEANISTAVIFGCHFRWDYMPFFTILHDYLATVAQELKQYDIELIDHHSVNLIHRYSSVEEMRLVSASHHLACARRYNASCYGTGYGFTEPTANIIWAVNRTLGADCHFSTLKRRLGLPNAILKTLPEEEDVIKTAFTFEKEHYDLFDGEQVGQVAIYFSNETQKHTFFGCVYDGYSKDYAGTLKMLFLAGVSPHTIFEFPADAENIPLFLCQVPWQ